MILILDNIRSMQNVATIFRTADAAGIEKIYLCGITPSPLDEFGRKRQQFIKFFVKYHYFILKCRILVRILHSKIKYYNRGRDCHIQRLFFTKHWNF